ncbi:hypothetical protein PGTUg99_003590 [Puccinia graminis f. sp. tritici]|uniref:RING-type domain-containing protein n=1 Tax=Puccinia graminis f. sp. tritici TaxID=56615 RepID=A0A5B0NBQ1_PUCGR|nr:hypothetical protein PGTUg99_003590 [Puccinia graminis f. sp. tritici]
MSHHQLPTTSHPRRPTTAQGSTSLRAPEHERRELIASTHESSSNTDENQDPFEYLGCSNCTDDFSSHRASHSSHKPKSFWLMECGHLACTPCLGYSNPTEVDPTQHHRCPIPSCRGFRSAVYELNRQKPIHPTIKEFFESPHSMTERLDSVLSFQNRQMRMRIRNLNHLVQVQRQALRQNQANSDQEVPILKHQVHDLKLQLRNLKLQLQQHSSRPAHQLPINLDQLDQQPSKPLKRRTTLDAHQGHRAPGIIARGARRSSFQQEAFHDPHIPPQAPLISRPQTATSFNSNPAVQIPRTTSRGANPERPLANMSHGNARLNPNRRQRTGEDEHQMEYFPSDDRRVYNQQLGAIPEDEDQGFEDHQPRVAMVPSRREPMQESVGGAARSASHLRTKQTSRIPLEPRNAHDPRIRPMPMPTPSRIAPTSNRVGQPVRRLQEAVQQPRRAANQTMNIPARLDLRTESNSPFGRFVYHDEDLQPKNGIVIRPDPRKPPPQIPIPKRAPPESLEQGTPSKRLNPLVSRGPVPPRFQVARGPR